MSLEACPDCGARASRLDQPEGKKVKTLSEKFDDFASSANKTVSDAGKALWGKASEAKAPRPKRRKAR